MDNWGSGQELFLPTSFAPSPKLTKEVERVAKSHKIKKVPFFLPTPRVHYFKFVFQFVGRIMEKVQSERPTEYFVKKYRFRKKNESEEMEMDWNIKLYSRETD